MLVAAVGVGLLLSIGSWFNTDRVDVGDPNLLVQFRGAPVAYTATVEELAGPELHPLAEEVILTRLDPSYYFGRDFEIAGIYVYSFLSDVLAWSLVAGVMLFGLARLSVRWRH